MGLFAIVFTASVEDIQKSATDTGIFLTIGLLVPILTVLAVTTLILGIKRHEQVIAIPIVLGIFSLIGILVYYGISSGFVVELFRLRFLQ